MTAASTSTPLALPELNEGELYAGILLGKNGEAAQHIVLLPGSATDVTWKKAAEWAASVGGELPTRREQSLLFANLGEHFERRAYWASEKNGSGWAWYQDFDGGRQGSLGTHFKLRARAVRRLSIQ